MKNSGYIQITIKGKKGNLSLTPDNYDIREIINVIETAENLLFPGKGKERPIISYGIEKGSVKHIFRTTLQYIIGFNALLLLINDSKSIDSLDYPTAKSFETFQDNAIKNDYEYTVKTSVQNSNELIISKSTEYYRSESIWIDAEFYFYGKITNMGGKERANFHLVTDNLGTLIIQTNRKYLEELEKNPLYKTYGIRAIGKQNSETAEIDKSSLQFLELIDYNKIYDEQYLNQLINKASESWAKIGDTTKWLNELRGNYDA